MRPRSGGIYAETNEGYLKLAIFCQSRDIQEKRNLDKNKSSSLVRATSRHQGRKAQHQVYTNNVEVKEENLNRSFVDNFDYHQQNEEINPIIHNSPSASTMDKIVLLTSVDSDILDGVNEAQPKIEKVHKIMMVGTRNTGKHTLIDSIFQDTESKDQAIDHSNCCMDLIIKRIEDVSSNTKYQFWIRELSDNKYDSLFKVYYKSVQIFIFVYSINNKDSFEKLDEAIGSIFNELPKKKFFGLLIGNQNDKSRVIKYEDGLELKKKYGLHWFIETNKFVERDTPQV